MAELQDQGGHDDKKGGPKQKKKSTRIDMTAMVDVAFLLLTFFILTTTMNSQKVMQLNVPPKPKDDITEDDVKVDVKESKMMTIILGKNDKVYYYFGITEPDLLRTDFSDNGIRSKVKKHLFKPGQERCKGKETEGCWDPIIVIKPMEQSSYRNLVDILDEMTITDAKKYALTKLNAADSTLLYDNNLL